jgi:hypothetical protein
MAERPALEVLLLLGIFRNIFKGDTFMKNVKKEGKRIRVEYFKQTILCWISTKLFVLKNKYYFPVSLYIKISDIK